MRLDALVGPDDAEVWVKLEAANPTGSYKDRMALAMIEGAERRGALSPGQTVVEYTGGSTGSSLALVCAVKGYPLRIVSSNAFAVEKLRTMAAFGAELEIIDSPQGIHPGLIGQMMDRAKEIVAETGGYATDQFNNRDALDGYRADRQGDPRAARSEPIHSWCAYVGIGGCFVGVGEVLRSRWSDIDAGRGRAGRVGRDLGRTGWDSSHRGRRRRLHPAQPHARHLRPRREGLDRRRVRDGATGRDWRKGCGPGRRAAPTWSPRCASHGSSDPDLGSSRSSPTPGSSTSGATSTLTAGTFGTC